LAVRAALGSGQGRLIRQVLTEGLLLSGIGAVLGVAIAYAAVRYFHHANPIELTVGSDVTVSLPVLGFGILLSIATTLIFGLLPAIRASQVDLAHHLKSGGRGFVPGRHILARALITIEMALSFMLLVGSSLFLTSALRMGSESLGFNPDRVLAAGIGLPAVRYPTDTERLRFSDRLLERLSHVPGAIGVALASKLPPNAGGNQVVEVRGRPVPEGSEIHDSGADAVSPAFFDVLNIPLRDGRTFNDLDRENSQPVAIVNEDLARKYFPHTNPLGQQLRLAGGSMPWLTIVGVVGNLKHTQLMNEMTWVETPILYRPLAQEPRQSVQVAVHATGDLASMSQRIERQIAGVDPLFPVGEVESLDSRLSKTLAYPRFRATVLALCAFGALILSAVGLHGVLSQLVAQRIPEFGVRRALGAETRDLLWLVARQGGIPVFLGLGAGACLTIGFSRLLASLLYGTDAAGPKALGLVSLALLAAAALAILLPAARAARVQPMAALRDE
jgi:putative ABC transport system permease protein